MGNLNCISFCISASLTGRLNLSFISYTFSTIIFTIDISSSLKFSSGSFNGNTIETLSAYYCI
jgi:hypothetical protein